MSENLASTAPEPSLSPPQPLRPSNSIRLNLPENSTSKQAQSEQTFPVKYESQLSRPVIRNVPHVVLDMDRISPAMAARLATSLLGHVLFLKSQIPFPVVQLSRMPSVQPESKATKKRMELISAIDTLTSHMQTTFMALSAAFALKGISEQAKVSNGESLDAVSPAMAQMLFLVGPSIGAVKAKTAFVADGLEVRPWGVRDELSLCDDPRPEVDIHYTASSDNDSDSEEEDGEDTDESDSRVAQEDLAGEFKNDDGDCAPGPPLSRSPSPSSPPSVPSTPSGSRPPTPLLEVRKPRGFTPLTDLPLPQESSSRIMPPPKKTYAEEQDILRAADRLLSRTLANGCAEENGGMSSELSASQTHVLLRAPRRFEHPAWTPRQNLTRSLEATMQSFVDDATTSVDQDKSTQSKKKPLRIGVKTEGVWISCRASSSEAQDDANSVKEEDELIWWQWNGKIAGFSEW